jgi:hypothetical protein
MAVVTTKSGQITNRDASPKVLNNSGIEKGDMQSSIGTLESVSGDSIGSKYIMCQIPSNAYVRDVFLSCDGGNTTGAADIGIYQTTENGGAVVDADFFASAQVLTSALARSSVVHESGVYGIEDIEKPLWEALGLSEDSHRMYDVALTLTAASDAADSISLDVQFAQ